MAKITFSDLTAAFASTTALNAKFQQIEDEFTNKILYRDEVSPMARDLDLNGFNLINVNNITSTATPSIDATNVVVTPAGNISSVNAQLALEELDAEKALLAGDPTQNFSVNNLTVTGNVDGRDVSVDGTKLDTIESGADVTDSTNVAAAGAVMDSDFTPAEGFLRKTGAGTYTAHKSNLVATGAPTVNDDSSAGYSEGSDWLDLTNDDFYKCLDSTVGAAVWVAAGLAAGTVASVAGAPPIVSSGGSTPTISITPATSSAAGSLSATDKAKLDSFIISGEIFSSLTYNAQSSYTIPSIVPNATQIEFSTDGTKMFACDTGAGLIGEYSLSTAFDITTASYTTSYAVTIPLGFKFKPDGTELYIFNSVSTNVEQHTLTTPWDLTTASASGFVYNPAETASVQSVTFNSTGTKAYLANATTVYQYSLSTPWRISTATYDTVSHNFSADTTTLFNLRFNSDQSYLYLSDSTATYRRYRLTTPGDLSTIALLQSHTFANNVSGFHIDSNAYYTIFCSSGLVQKFSFAGITITL